MECEVCPFWLDQKKNDPEKFPDGVHCHKCGIWHPRDMAGETQADEPDISLAA